MRSGGGFYDHVVPPDQGVPDDECADILAFQGAVICTVSHHNPAVRSPCQYGGNATQRAIGCHKPFDFRRLGIRVTSMLMSPWIPANTAIKSPKVRKELPTISILIRPDYLC